jgi:hypothetical protein
MKAGQIFELVDQASFYRGRLVEIVEVSIPGFAWVKLANYGPGSVEFNVKISELKEV